MTSKMIIFTFALCISLVLATDGNPEDEKSHNDQNILDESLSDKEELHAGGSNKRWFGSTSNNLRKSVDQQQKLDLELAIETTRLEELNKLKEAEQIDDTTPSAKLSKWQKRLLSDISKTIKKKENLTTKAAVTKTLVEKLTASSTTSVKNERQIIDRTKKIIKALGDQHKINMELAIATKKLEELENQKETEKIVIVTAPNKLTKWQRNLLNDLIKAKEKKGDLTIAVAIIKTKIDQLKQQLTELGGSPDSIATTSNKFKKQISEKIYKAETNLSKINIDLALATTKLEQLEKLKKDEKIEDQNIKTNLTKKQKNLLNDIEKAKEKKYGLNLKTVVGKTLIEQLKLQLKSN